MENIHESSIFEFNLDEESRSNLSSIARWTNINAITGFVGIGISIISFFVGLGKLGKYGSSAAVAGPGLIGLFIGIGISLALNITLINAAINIKKGVSGSSQGHFTSGVTKLATYFKIVGILTIIAIVLITLIMLIAIMSGPGRGF